MLGLYELLGASVRWVLSGFRDFSKILDEPTKNFWATTFFLVVFFTLLGFYNFIFKN